MKRLAVFLLAPLLLAATTPGQPSVFEHFGNIGFSNGQGLTKTLTSDHQSGHPVLSPDGRTLAWIHIDKAAQGSDEPGITSLWIGDAFTGASRRLAGDAAGDDADDLHAVVDNPQNVAFSLDGGFVYVTSDLADESPGVHQINIATGQHKFVIDGSLKRLIRTGPYRGDLIVLRHVHNAPPRAGSYEASFVVGTDGKKVIMIPGSDNAADRSVVDRWLEDKGWKAW